MSGEAGQALVVAVLAVGIGATAVMGLRAAQERLLATVRLDRAGEAAAQAAGAEIADLQLALIRGRRLAPTAEEDRAFLEASATHEAALAAAATLAASNGAPAPTALLLRDAGRSIEVEVEVAARRHRVSIEKVPCCPR